jgi:hypothetical protein
MSGVNKSTVKKLLYRFGYRTNNHMERFFERNEELFEGEQFRAFCGDGGQ